MTDQVRTTSTTAATADTFTALFEGAPRFLARLEAAGPFADDEALFAAARSIAVSI